MTTILVGDIGEGRGQKTEGVQEVSFFGLTPKDTSLATALHQYRLGEGWSTPMDSWIDHMQQVQEVDVTMEDINRLVEAGVLAISEEG